MEDFRIAIFGCGTIGGGAARVLLDNAEEFSRRAGRRLVLAGIVDRHPLRAAGEHGLPLALFLRGPSVSGQAPGADPDAPLDAGELAGLVDKVLASPDIDLVVETIGGGSDSMLRLALRILESGKHLVTANKALLSRHANAIFAAAEKRGKTVGFETSVCTSIPVIRALEESFASDEVLALSGIMNGTSNYVLTSMQEEGMGFEAALARAQERGYAEADPSLDIGGADAAHKLIILMKLAFGIDVAIEELEIQGIGEVTAEDHELAEELEAVIKLVAYAQKREGTVYGTVRPMLVKRSNLLSRVGGATNAVRLLNKYTGENTFIGRGAGCLEGGSAILSDVIFIARYEAAATRLRAAAGLQDGAACEFRSLDDMLFPYHIVFDTEDLPGITGAVTTAIGHQDINIDTVGHNRRGRSTAVFSVATMPCTFAQLRRAIEEIKRGHPGILKAEPRIMPILH